MPCCLSVAKLRRVGVSCLQDTVKNLYNINVKLQCREQPFKSAAELPTYQVTHLTEVADKLRQQLAFIFQEEDETTRDEFIRLARKVIQGTCGHDIKESMNDIYVKAWQVVEQWGAADELFVGVIPKPLGEGNFTTEFDDTSKRVYVHWEKDVLGEDFLEAVTRMLGRIRDEGRQPTPDEYLVKHLAYIEIQQGKWGRHEHIRTLGTPGFRPHTQTYMSLTDPGEGHVMGTTRFNSWMQGAIVHVEHLERPRNLPREIVESYRVPSVLDFSHVRLHVGSSAPTTYFLGRACKDSGNFDEDFLKIVNITSAAASSAFFMGAAEVKISMEGLSTAQAFKYMEALRTQVQRSARKQMLSAAWNLNQTIPDDYLNGSNNPSVLTERIDIATTAVRITSLAGFDKVTWDGASDTYPSKCIMYQLTFEEALTIVHEAHSKGLVTYFSAGFKFNEIQHAVYAGVDGIGIGGAQVLRYMDGETGMHGPYTEENIPLILQRRDEAARSTRGRGVDLLVKLDTMFFEGSISRLQEFIRQKLFSALLDIDNDRISEVLDQLKDVVAYCREDNSPFIHRAKRIIEAEQPLLKGFCPPSEWQQLVKVLKPLIVARDEDGLMEEYDSDPWLALRCRYRNNQCSGQDSFVRQVSFNVSYKC